MWVGKPHGLIRLGETSYGWDCKGSCYYSMGTEESMIMEVDPVSLLNSIAASKEISVNQYESANGAALNWCTKKKLDIKMTPSLLMTHVCPQPSKQYQVWDDIFRH